jgi:hypothetical protein
MISFVWYAGTKRYKLSTKKHLNDALPVLSNIQVMLDLTNIVLWKGLHNKEAIT